MYKLKTFDNIISDWQSILLMLNHFIKKYIDLNGIFLQRNGNDVNWLMSNIKTRIYLQHTGIDTFLNILQYVVWFIYHTVLFQWHSFSKT